MQFMTPHTTLAMLNACGRVSDYEGGRPGIRDGAILRATYRKVCKRGDYAPVVCPDCR
jgi:hypothetical protein